MPRSEADTRAQLIDPAIHARGWTEDLIKREETAGAIEIVNGKARRQSKGFIDYTLRVRVNMATQPVAMALIEAKSEDKPPTHGLEQAKKYAEQTKRLNVQFVFSSNGHLFVEYDRHTKETSKARPMSEFPTPDELRQRYEARMGFRLDDAAAKPLLTPYSGGEATRRYYQDAAIRAVFEKIARCVNVSEPRRALLSLATGAGKTFNAVQILKRIADAGQLGRALFICDRDELRDQGAAAFKNVFGADAQDVFQKSDGTNNAKNARVHIATYQTLDVASDDASANFLKRHYPANYFSHIIIDECHRSAWHKWSEILKANPAAVQIGLTATPRELVVNTHTPEGKADAQITADNFNYFGLPVYEYDLAQGIDDGYLAACEIQRSRVNLDDTGITIDDILALKPVNANTGQPMTREQLQELYEKTTYEDRILLPDRVAAMCADLFSYLLQTGGPAQKSIIFCVRDRHADDVAIELNNLYARWCAENGQTPLDNYAFKCTAASSGNDELPDLRASTRSHFIATTVDLLSTGVDVPVVRNIVFFKYVRSPIAFYQMVGRGTRLDPASNKLMFRVYDYTNATRLFGERFLSRARPEPKAGEPAPDYVTAELEPVIQVQGFDVHVTDAGRYIVTMVDGKAMPVTVEEYKEKLAARLVAEAPTLDDFRIRWIEPQARREMMGRLPDAGRSPMLVRDLAGMVDYDLYDVLADLAYGLNPRSRKERAEAFGYKHGEWLATLPLATAATVKAITAQFARGGTDGLENPAIFQTPEVRNAGGLEALKKHGQPFAVLAETKERIFAA